MRFDGLQKSPAKADVTVEDLLGCPDGTVFGGEYKDEPNAWSGFCSADEGRKDVATSYYQHFTDCYYYIPRRTLSWHVQLLQPRGNRMGSLH